jgi:hypothetical protein
MTRAFAQDIVDVKSFRLRLVALSWKPKSSTVADMAIVQQLHRLPELIRTLPELLILQSDQDELLYE